MRFKNLRMSDSVPHWDTRALRYNVLWWHRNGRMRGGVVRKRDGNERGKSKRGNIVVGHKRTFIYASDMEASIGLAKICGGNKYVA